MKSHPQIFLYIGILIAFIIGSTIAWLHVQFSPYVVGEISTFFTPKKSVVTPVLRRRGTITAVDKNTGIIEIAFSSPKNNAIPFFGRFSITSSTKLKTMVIHSKNSTQTNTQLGSSGLLKEIEPGMLAIISFKNEPTIPLETVSLMYGHIL